MLLPGRANTVEADSIDTTCKRKTPKDEQEKGEVPNRDN